MGLTAMVVPVPIPDQLLRVDLWIMLAASLAITPFIMRRLYITRTVGIIFLLGYAAYLAFVLMPYSSELVSYAR
jgi:cation:H+ antiporter